MGIIDIFYHEVNRWRDNLKSQEEKNKVVKEALKKTLIKFEFLWGDQIEGHAYRGEQLKDLLREISEDFLNIAVEVKVKINDEEIVNNLREISKQFMQVANSPRMVDTMEIFTGEISQSMSRIDIIKKRLEE